MLGLLVGFQQPVEAGDDDLVAAAVAHPDPALDVVDRRAPPKPGGRANRGCGREGSADKEGWASGTFMTEISGIDAINERFVEMLSESPDAL